MAEKGLTWKGGSLGADEGRYMTASDWSGDSVPRSGDTVVIKGIANSGIGHIGSITTFPIGSPYTSVYLFPAPTSPNQPISDPGSLKGYDITGQTIILNGEAGAIQLWAEETTLTNDTISVIGTAVIESDLDNRFAGTIHIGSGHSAGTLELDLSGADTAGVTIPDHVAETALAGHTTIGAGSELKVEALTSSGEPPEILAAFKLEGNYSAAGFHLSGNSASELLSLSYSPLHAS